MRSLLPWITLCLLPTLGFGAIYEDASQLPHNEYDFVVIGGGTAGNVIANRLTEIPDVSVLVLEAGVSNEGILTIEVPAFGYMLPGTQVDWNYTVTVIGNRTSPYARGFVLGGSSCLNGMVYTRGSAEDWDRYAEITGDQGWSWDSIQHYIRKNERFSPPADHHNTSGEFDPSVHGFHGIHGVSLNGFRHEMEDFAINASKEEGSFVLDYNAGVELGVGWGQSTIANGTRSSSSTTYLGPQFINRPNLDVLLHAHVTRIISNNSTDNLTFHSVEFSQDAGESFLTVNATKEIVLSGGTIGTAQILMNSGVGDTDALSQLGIEPLLHLPSVGQNLTDQPIVVYPFIANTNDTDDIIHANDTLREELLHQWNETHTGPLVDPDILLFGWFRLPDNSSIYETQKDPSAGPNTAQIEWVFVNGAFVAPPDDVHNFISVSPQIVSPASRGSITLNTSNPFDHPIIDLNLLSSDFDLFALRQGLRDVERFMKSPIFDGFIQGPGIPINSTTPDDQVDDYIRSTTLGTFHVAGTAAMSAKDADWGVLNPDLKLKGAEGIRVVDASIFPVIPAAHTQAPTYIVAERAADLIKATWNLAV